jgi:hypothetical protein
MGAWTVLLLSYAAKDRPPPLFTVLLLVVWTNLHTSFPLAAPIGAAIAFDNLVQSKWRNLREWLLFALASLVAVLANANGLAGVLQPFRISGLDMLGVIGEWSPSTTHNTPEFFVVLLLGLAALLWHGVRVPMGRLALLLTTLGMALVHVRHQSSFIILAACILPPLIPAKHPAKPIKTLLVLAAFPILLVRFLVPTVPPEGEANPRKLIAAIPADLRSKPVFNGYTFGGPLILGGVKPYIDGRAEMYGDDFVIGYSKIVHGDMRRFNEAVARYDIRWTILPNSEQRTISEIESTGTWRRIYADGVGVIDVRIKRGRNTILRRDRVSSVIPRHKDRI